MSYETLRGAVRAAREWMRANAPGEQVITHRSNDGLFVVTAGTAIATVGFRHEWPEDGSDCVEVLDQESSYRFYAYR